MNSSFLSTIRPKYVALDTSTWINLFKRRTDPDAKDVIDALNSGEIIPYVSFEHVLELVQHSDQNVRLEQLDFSRVIQTCRLPKTDLVSGSLEKFTSMRIISGCPRA